MALDIASLTDRWGKEFGSVNVINEFRGVTIYDRADEVNALFPNAADQRIVVDNLYDQTVAADQNIASLASVYESIAQRTLETMCQDDLAELPTANTDTAYLNKLINDMIVGNQTFQLPTVAIGGDPASAEAIAVTTMVGLPTGNGLFIGVIVNPYTGVALYYSFEETLRFICTNDVLSSDTTTFTVSGTTAVDSTDALWPTGSGASITVDQSSTDLTLVPNADFQTWETSDTDTPSSWVLDILDPGTTIKRETDPYIGTYNAQLVAALINSSLTQDIVLTANTNYLVGIRHKNIAIVTTGEITLAFTDADGVPLQDQLGNNLETAIDLTGGIDTDYSTSWALFSVPKTVVTTTPKISIKVMTAFDGAAVVNIANLIVKPFVEVYANGPQVITVPGNINAAIGDTYSLAVENSAGVDTFVRCLDRLYGLRTLRVDLPVDPSPTILDSKIS